MATSLRRCSEYMALKNAIGRCHDPAHQSYHNYGARGITVDPDWHGPDGFEKFIDHIGYKPDPKLTLDRIDNNKGYTYGNVAWTDRKTQQTNRRKPQTQAFNRTDEVTFQGRTQTWNEWAAELGLQMAAIRQRYARGWPLEKVLAPRIRKTNKMMIADGKPILILQWAITHNKTYNEVCEALSEGFTPAEILADEHKGRDRPLWGKLYEYKGERKTITEWARTFDMRWCTLRTRIVAGQDIATAIETPVMRTRPRKPRVELLNEPDDPCRATVDRMIALLAKSADDIGSRKH